MNRIATEGMPNLPLRPPICDSPLIHPSTHYNLPSPTTSLRNRIHPLRSHIPLPLKRRLSIPRLPTHNLLLHLHQRAAMAAARCQTVGKPISLDAVRAAHFSTFDHLVDESTPANVLKTEVDSARSVDARIALKTRVLKTDLCLSEDEAGTAARFEAQIPRIKAIPETMRPLPIACTSHVMSFLHVFVLIGAGAGAVVDVWPLGHWIHEGG